MFEFKEITKESEFNPLTINGDAPFTQALFFGKWQEMAGRKVRRFEIKQRREILGFFQVIKFPFLFSQSFLYIPHGPILKEIGYLTGEFLKEFRQKLYQIGLEENSVFVRFDIFLPSRPALRRRFWRGESFSKGESDLSKYFKKVPSYGYLSSYFQPKLEWIVNLEKTEDELFNEMHPKNRYNIRLAEKRGVKIEIVKDDFEKYFNDFYKLLKETAGRDNFNLHPKNYYQNIFKTLNSNNAFLAVARYDNKILLVNLVLLYGNAALFVFGGSSDEHKNLMFSHLAQWEAIKESKTLGMAVYNFGGVNDSGNYKTYSGISFFKKRFGGEILEHSDSYDIVPKPFWYYLYNLRKWLLNQK